jgi:hypothetical protein
MTNIHRSPAAAIGVAVGLAVGLGACGDSNPPSTASTTAEATTTEATTTTTEPFTSAAPRSQTTAPATTAPRTTTTVDPLTNLQQLLAPCTTPEQRGRFTDAEPPMMLVCRDGVWQPEAPATTAPVTLDAITVESWNGWDREVRVGWCTNARLARQISETRAGSYDVATLAVLCAQDGLPL